MLYIDFGMTHHHPPLDAEAWLRKNKFRVTQARIAIVRLLDSSPVPLTLNDIHAQLGAEGGDFATVFRFVSSLEEKSLVEKIAWADGSTRHEIRCCTDQAHHHHYLICRACKKVEPIEDCVVQALEDQIAKERGYVAVSHTLQLSGVCPSCQKNPPAETR